MAITNGYCTLNQIKAAVRITDSVDDALLEMAVESASRMIDAECDRSFLVQERQPATSNLMMIMLWTLMT